MKANLQITALALIVSGCMATPLERAASDIRDDIGDRAAQISDDAKSRSPSYRKYDEPYVGGEVVLDTERETVPELRTRVAFRSAVEVTLAELVQYLSEQTGLRYELSDDVSFSAARAGQQAAGGQSAAQGAGNAAEQRGDLSPVFSVRAFQGRAHELLDYATAATNTYWEYDDGFVLISRYQTRMWQLAGLPGSASLINQGSSTGASGSQAGGGGGGGGSGSGGSGSSGGGSQSTQASTGSQGATVSMSVDYYQDVAATVEALLSAGGQAQVSPSSNTLIVNDTPTVLRRVDRIVKQLNDLTVEPIVVQMDVYSVASNQRESYGLDWSVVYETLNGRYLFSSGVGGPTDPETNAFGVEVIDPTFNYDGTQAVVRALSAEGFSVAAITEELHSVHGRPSDVHVGIDRTIQSSVSRIIVPDAGITVTPETTIVSDGVSLTWLPVRLPNGDVMLQMQLSFSDVRSIETIETDGLVTQNPEVETKRVINTVRLEPGRTILVDAFSSIGAQQDRQGIGDPAMWMAGGSNNSRIEHETLIVALTLKS